MAFYDDMAAMTADLLGGELGQGTIEIVRQVEGVPDEDESWLPVGPSELVDVVDQIAEPEAEYTAAGTVIRTEAAYMITPPQLFVPKVGDRIRIGGQDAGGIVHLERLGSLEVAVYYTIYVNR